MAHAIERYIEHEAWQVAAIQTAMDELDKGQADLVEHATVVGWLDHWGTEGEVEPPHAANMASPGSSAICRLYGSISRRSTLERHDR